MPRPLFDVAVAKSQTEVVTKFNEIVAKHDIQIANVKQVTVTPFGQNRFLVLLAFLGAYVQTAAVGLKVVSLYGLTKAPKKLLIGLLSKKTKLVSKAARKPLAGLKVSVAQVYTDN